MSGRPNGAANGRSSRVRGNRGRGGRGCGTGGGKRAADTEAQAPGGVRGAKAGRGEEGDPCLDELFATASAAPLPSVAAGYFACKGRASKSTSSVAELKLGLGEGRQFQDVLDGVPIKHFNHMESLRVERSKAFMRWRFLLSQRFSLLLHGVGSKRKLLEDFAESSLTDGGCLLVYGFLPTTKARDVLDACASALLRASASSKRASARELVQGLRELGTERRLYVVLHNIDGPALRDAESQVLLSQIADCPAISLVASMDHLDTALLWEKQMSSRFNWIWEDATTYAPYMAEAALQPSLLLGRKSEQTSKGATVVLVSLPQKARRIFQVLAENQNNSSNKEQGLSIAEWFRLCREQFLVTAEGLLRSHLTEFKDHELVRIRKGSDGTDLYYIPLDETTLAQVLADMNAA
eukprot:jgi/Tetstr1/461015/TSEL_006165.t1